MITELASVLGGLLTGIGGAVAAGMFQRRKRRADAALVLTRAARQMVEPLSRQIETMNAELDEYRRAVAAAEQRCRQAGDRHATWDYEVRCSLRELGADVPPPPPVEKL